MEMKINSLNKNLNEIKAKYSEVKKLLQVESAEKIRVTEMLDRIQNESNVIFFYFHFLLREDRFHFFDVLIIYSIFYFTSDNSNSTTFFLSTLWHKTTRKLP